MKRSSAETLPVVLNTHHKANRAVGMSLSAYALSRPASVNDIASNLKSPFLDNLAPSELESVLELAERRTLPANSVITNQEESAERLFLLLTGRGRFFVVTEKGQKVIHLWIPPGAVIGVATLLSPPLQYLVSAETVTDSSVLVWDRATIRNAAARYPRLFENALSLSLQYLTAYHAAHMALISGSARERLAYVLVTLARGIGRNVTGGIELKIRNEELANEANVTPFTASRLLNEWKRDGMLVKGRGKILLRAPEMLLQHAT
jgi:CRP-like cAMP-binding protein